MSASAIQRFYRQARRFYVERTRHPSYLYIRCLKCGGYRMMFNDCRCGTKKNGHRGH